MSTRGRIELQHAERFILGGKASFLFTNTETGNTEWYFVKEKSSELYYVYTTKPDYDYIGKIVFRKFVPIRNFLPEDNYKRSVQVFEYVWKRIADLTLQDSIHVMHLGVCSVCGRRLSDPESIRLGIGPKCLSNLKTHRHHG